MLASCCCCCSYFFHLSFPSPLSRYAQRGFYNIRLFTIFTQNKNRSLGDAVAHTAGVISDPEFTERELDPDVDKFVVVATDGLWEFVDNDDTIDLALEADSPSDSVDLLVKEANARWMREEQVIDDTTIIAAHLFGYKTS